MEQFRVEGEGLEALELQPLHGEIVHQRLWPGVARHPPHLRGWP
jgi:hypothetical protein